MQVAQAAGTAARERGIATVALLGKGGGAAKDLAWLRPDGLELAPADWQDAERREIGMLISGEAHDEVDEHGRPVEGDTLLLLLNAGALECVFRAPALAKPGRFELLLATGAAEQRAAGEVLVPARSLALLVHLAPA